MTRKENNFSRKTDKKSRILALFFFLFSLFLHFLFFRIFEKIPTVLKRKLPLNLPKQGQNVNISFQNRAFLRDKS